MIIWEVFNDRTIDYIYFSKANERSKYIPEEIHTDGLWSYEKAIKREFRFGTHHMVNFTKHIRNVGLNKKDNNNIVERYHGTFREFDKIRRAFKGKEKDMVEAFRLWYNFIRKHQAIGKTPAEQIGVNLELGQNKWLGLVKHSMK